MSNGDTHQEFFDRRTIRTLLIQFAGVAIPALIAFGVYSAKVSQDVAVLAVKVGYHDERIDTLETYHRYPLGPSASIAIPGERHYPGAP